MTEPRAPWTSSEGLRRGVEPVRLSTWGCALPCDQDFYKASLGNRFWPFPGRKNQCTRLHGDQVLAQRPGLVPVVCQVPCHCWRFRDERQSQLLKLPHSLPVKAGSSDSNEPRSQLGACSSKSLNSTGVRWAGDFANHSPCVARV